MSIKNELIEAKAIINSLLIPLFAINNTNGVLGEPCDSTNQCYLTTNGCRCVINEMSVDRQEALYLKATKFIGGEK